MPNDNSPFDLLVDAFRDAKTQMKEATDVVRTDIVRPLDPNATQLTKSQRREEFQRFMVDEAIRASEFTRLAQRFNLPKDKPIPRRLVEYVIQGMREESL